MNNSFRVPFRASGGMPEYRQQSAGPQAGANASARLDDSAGRIVSGQAMRNAEADARGWERFNRGLQGFLKTGVGLYNQYRDKTSRSLVDDALLRAREEMEAWRSEYEKTHQGKDGLTAEADYNQAWGRISKAHMKRLREQGVSGPYEHLADLHLRENGLRYNKQGGAFQQQQHKAWNTSIYEGQKDELVREVQRDPDNAQWHGFLKGGILETYKRLHPGEDTSKLENDLDRLIAVNSMETRIAAQDFEGARRDIALFSGKGNTSGRNLAANNFGNVKNTSGSYNAYATRHDGLMGVGERVLRYSNAPERGWHATTLRQMVGIYAPASDGNDPAGYAAWLGKHLGIGPDEKVNFRDPKILAGLIRHMPVMEHGAKRVSVSEEEAMRAAQALLAGKKPNITGQAAVSGGAALSPEETAKFKQTIDALDHKKQVNDFLAGTAGLSAPERMALLEEQYGGKPEAREQYDAISKGIMHDVSAQEAIKQFERKERKNSLLKKMESFADLDPEQSFAKMQEIAQSLPLDERDDFYKAANNLRNPGRHDDPLAVQEITERLLNGEDVYVLAEYGPRLSPATAKKLGNQAYQQALPTIKSAFDDAGNEFFGNSSNKTHAQGMGVPNMTAMWTHFLNQTDADEKMDIPRLRKEAQDFFKPFVLNKSWSAFNVHTIRGLQDRALKMYAGSWPEQGTEEYGIATNFLKEQKVEPESVFGKYTDEQLAKGYRQYRSMKRGGNPDGAGK